MKAQAATSPTITLGNQKYVKTVCADRTLIGCIEGGIKRGTYIVSPYFGNQHTTCIKGKDAAIAHLVEQAAQVLADIKAQGTKGDTRLLSGLESEDYALIQQEQELAAVLEYVPTKEQAKVKLFSRDTITGAVVKHGDGEYLEVWLTTNPAYYALSATYTRVA